MKVSELTGNRRFPLHVHISFLFTLLLLSTGIVLGIFNYQQTSRIILSSSLQLFEHISDQVDRDLRDTYIPVDNLLNLLALDERNMGETRDARLSMLPVFAQALKDHPKLASLYLGYTDGDFFMVRPLRTEKLKKIFNTPDNAAFQVWSIERTKGAPIKAMHLYFDAKLNYLGDREISNESYDARTRPWYQEAMHSNAMFTTEPYVFFSSGDVGTTVSRVSMGRSVIGADITLADLSQTLAKHKITPSTEVALYSPDGLAVAYPDITKLITGHDKSNRANFAQLSPVTASLSNKDPDGSLQGSIELDKRGWLVSQKKLNMGGPKGLRLAILAPEDELLADAYRMRWISAVITLGILLLCIPLGWALSRLLVKPLRGLLSEAEAIRRFDFKHPASASSPVLEIELLAVAMARMKETISSFLEIAASLSAETRFEALLERVLEETAGISQAHAGLIYLSDAEGKHLEAKGLYLDGPPMSLAELKISSFAIDDERMPDWLKKPVRGGASSIASIGFDQAGDYQKLLQAMDSPRTHIVATGLHNRQGDTVGVLVLLHKDSGTEADIPFQSPARVAFVEAVSGVAALCIESQRLLDRQRQLLDAFIQLIAGAIDAKSPYTGGHCQRVPEITMMLAKAAANSHAPAFRDYCPTDEEWEALHIAAWLHDCGKVTTPEYVVDKATKLETLYDRIHEIRSRFEILKRDAWISYWQARAEGGDDRILLAQRDQLLAELDEEFSFVARCNLGGEAMAEDDIQRLQRIAERKWWRTLDDRLGLSWEESQRMESTPTVELPVLENLLADRPRHLVERPASELIAENNRWGFKLEVPRYKFNRGELYNLSIARGTLTAEERYIINHHIVQTILMLDHLPFPKHLKNVAEIAGGHHEKMDGTGYPKRLRREEMSLPARMMAIADIFEALTAVDRPYKKGKSLSEAIAIMAGMCRGAHIDPDLFGLFIRKQIYKQYAERFMQPEQIDEVDETQTLIKAGLAD
ncbi:HD domain-containing phosphohydrolase [Pseudomonas sp. RL_15y_Pfl2_60]|uniref:HD domain-containing phosphohydrolase n=1 Tax=Pseudomonas sp. RL_15y_Pfl2_60 TaxID=3088709 RepID=UPI0030D86CBC